MIPTFRELSGSSAILVSKTGVWRQTNLFEYGGFLFAKHGSGFVALYANKTTSAKMLRWESYLPGAEEIHADKLGRLICVGEGVGLPPHLRELPTPNGAHAFNGKGHKGNGARAHI